MKEGINLALQGEEKIVDLKRIFIVPVGLFSIVFLASLVLLIYNFMLKRELGELVAKENTLTQSIEASSEKKAKILLLHDRMQLIDKIIQSRRTLYKKAIEILAIVPSDMEVGDLNVSDERVSVGVTSDNLLSVNDLFTRIENVGGTLPAVTKVTVAASSFLPGFEEFPFSLTFEFSK